MKNESTGALRKALLFAAIILCAALTVGCVASAWLMYNEEFYTTPKDLLIEKEDLSRMRRDAKLIVHHLLYADYYAAEPLEVVYADTATNLRYVLFDENGEIAASNVQAIAGKENYTYESGWKEIPVYLSEYRNANDETQTFTDITLERPNRERGDYHWDNTSTYRMFGMLAADLPVQDGYRFMHLLYNAVYGLRYAVYPVGAVSFLLAILCFILLMCASARRPRQAGLFPGPLHAVPFDLLAAVCIVPVALFLDLMSGLGVGSTGFTMAARIAASMLLIACVALGLLMSAAARIKTGTIFRNTVVWRTIMLLWEILKWFGRGLRKVGEVLWGLCGAIPRFWKLLVLFAALLFFEIMVFGASYPDVEVYWIFHVIEAVVLLGIALWRALSLRKLGKGGEALAAGNLSYHVDPGGMPRDLKKQAEALNRIGVGMNRAVEERMKSERMKTELITNVSHDIKTPLTSIINYTDLLSKEDSGNVKIREYTEVLTRQSVRLKRLIDDLVEASKASSGALDVSLVPCDASVFLEQAAGEYDQRLTDAGMTLCMAHPDHPVTILADGRRLWRVFDNLMNNILKYGQSGTRVYLTLEEINRFAVITFRNVSRDPLNVSPDELMERFVRGDASRSSATEGNGLGLSIAKSLTELQGGALTLAIDGDLFKATLHFPVAGSDPLPAAHPTPTLASGTHPPVLEA
ncbi:MAG: HAMP domain-containing histidine kinase [Clostridia bacterium]|nr:HAMP domain-containing histidine kinase [Clostridia bacterium]